MTVGSHRRAIGTFSSRQDAEYALAQLRDSGFPMEQVSVVARNTHTDAIAGAPVSDHIGNQAGEGATAGAVTGGAVGGLTGLLVGLGAVTIPGLGPILVGGAAATALVATLSGGAMGAAAGGLIGALLGIGIPEDRARIYSDRITQGDYLILVEGSQTDISQAESILNLRGIRDWGIYDATPAGRNVIL